MKYPKVLVLLTLAVSLLLGGCASMSSNTAPGADLTRVKKIYVVKLPADERGIERVMADQLNLMGYQATSGTADRIPQDIDATLTYQDKWMWDITMYMLELNVQLRAPKTEIALATAKSYRPSLQRKSPAEMAREVLESIFNKTSKAN